MTFVEVRNKLIAHLWEYLGCPVVLSNQVQPEAEMPFGIYTVTAPYVSDGGLGDITEKEVEGGRGGTPGLQGGRLFPSCGI